ncbi:MAG: uncharacterized protein A8A55_1371 [Amphiamblys sp. WSBS2006]|nr:MAG: uncharacterized protein A8A55_1371 [Amphiamblys sp. WSBS2006]
MEAADSGTVGEILDSVVFSSATSKLALLEKIEAFLERKGPGEKEHGEILVLVGEHFLHADKRVREKAFAVFRKHTENPTAAVLSYTQLAQCFGIGCRETALGALDILSTIPVEKTLLLLQLRTQPREVRIVDHLFHLLCERMLSPWKEVKEKSLEILATLPHADRRLLRQAFAKEMVPEEKKGEDGNAVPFTETACGALVHGLEDVDADVRMKTLETLFRLGMEAVSIGAMAIDHTIDLLNDTEEAIRHRAVLVTNRLAEKYNVVIGQDQLMEIVLTVDDASPEIRQLVRSFLRKAELHGSACLQKVETGLGRLAQKRPAETRDILHCLCAIGKNNRKHLKDLFAERSRKRTPSSLALFGCYAADQNTPLDAATEELLRSLQWTFQLFDGTSLTRMDSTIGLGHSVRRKLQGHGEQK